VALPLLTPASMPEPDEPNVDEHVERRVTYETVSATSTKSSYITFIIVLLVALALTAWILMELR
jgi:hypothetical protein